jgi:hypothetical protein
MARWFTVNFWGKKLDQNRGNILRLKIENQTIINKPKNQFAINNKEIFFVY